jgi:hypothetical protein
MIYEKIKNKKTQIWDFCYKIWINFHLYQCDVGVYI